MEYPRILFDSPTSQAYGESMDEDLSQPRQWISQAITIIEDAIEEGEPEGSQVALELEDLAKQVNGLCERICA